MTHRLSHLPGTIPFNAKCMVGKPQTKKEAEPGAHGFYIMPEVGAMHFTILSKGYVKK